MIPINTVTDENGIEWTLVRGPDGKWRISWTSEQSVPEAPFGISTGPPSIFLGTSEPIDAGTFVHAQVDTLPHTNPKKTAYVLVSQESENGVDYVRVRVFDFSGKLLLDYRRRGRFVELKTQAGATAKCLRIEDGLTSYQEWIVIDWARQIACTLPAHEVPDPDLIVEMEKVGEFFIIVERWRGNTWVRLRIRDAQGREIHVVELPGEFVRGADDERRTKIIVSTFRDAVYFELILPETGARITPADSLGSAHNHIPGKLVHLQVDQLEPTSRFVLVVFDPQRGQSTVAIVDASGRVLTYHVSAGNFLSARVNGEIKEFTFRDAQGELRVKINLRTGRIEPN